MREIKFRAWDKDSSSMIVNSTRKISFRGEVDGGDDLILMQYTGLKDKNGIEIYEGDICEYHNDRGVYIGIVKYVDEYSAFRLVFDDGLFTDLSFAKVIGNIFQDKGLLNDSQQAKSNSI